MNIIQNAHTDISSKCTVSSLAATFVPKSKEPSDIFVYPSPLALWTGKIGPYRVPDIGKNAQFSFVS